MIRKKILLLAAIPCLSGSASGQGWLLFQNYWTRIVYSTPETQGYWTNEARPVWLADGVTKAAGSNYVVELWAASYGAFGRKPEMQLVDTVSMLEGDKAGLFKARSGQYYQVNSVYCGGPVLVSIKVWDRRTGTNYQNASLRGSVSFMNETGDPCIITQPEGLTGLPSLCLGPANCGSTAKTIEFSYPLSYTAALTWGSGVVSLQRVGHLEQTNTVDYTTFDLTATNGQEYIGQSGTATFLPGEAIVSFIVPIRPEGLNGKLVHVGLLLTNAQPDALLGLSTRTLELYDDRPTLRWLTSPGEVPKTIGIISYKGVFRLEYSPTLSPSNWTNAPYEWHGTEAFEGKLAETFSSEHWPTGFYRAGPF